MSARTILVLSLVANLALVASVVQRLAVLKPAPGRPGSTHYVASESLPEPKLIPAEKPRLESATSLPTGLGEAAVNSKFDWSRIETPDFKQLIANLRAIGCPEQTIRDLVTAAVLRFYAPRLAALRGADRPFQFWDSTANLWNPERIERERKLRALQKERNDFLKELLGVDMIEERRKQLGWPDRQAEMLTYLSKEKASQVMEIQRQFSERQQEVRLRSRGFRDADDDAEFNRLAKEQLASLGAVLTPQEMFEHQLREFGGADELAGFGPTEAEFRTIFKLEHYTDPAQAELDPRSVTPEQRKTIAAQKAAELKAALGETRYTEYERSQNSDYRQIERVTDRYELGKETAVKLWEMRQAGEAQAFKINANPALADEVREAARLAVRLEVEKIIQGTLGERAWKSLQRTASDWLDNIQQLPPQAPLVRP